MVAKGNEGPSANQDYYRLLLPQAFVGLVDAISYMVVAPSIVFYVLGLGGTKEQYGIIVSAFSFASFLFKPVLGYWCDSSGYTFRLPYLVSIAASSLGGLLYFVASAFSGKRAIAVILIARFLGGMGAANSTLGFTYVAAVVPHDQMTKFSSLLSMVRVVGMATAPALNLFLNDLGGSIGSFEVTPLNSVGLFLMILNVVSFFVIYLHLKEPPEQVKPSTSPVGVEKRGMDFWKSLFSVGILLPIFNILALNANFQLLETGLAPAASNLLGWGPVGISSLFGANSIFIFGLIVVTFQLASNGVSDVGMLMVGLTFSIVGYTLLYFLWYVGVPIWKFISPFLLATCAFPFLAAPTRSIFTRNVDADPVLRMQQGTMQAIMSMAVSVAGFTAPGLIASFVLRTPEQVAASRDQREFTCWALFAPLFSFLVLVGFAYLRVYQPEIVAGDKGEQEEVPGERTSLLEGSIMPHGLEIPQEFHPRTEAYRRHTVTLMGIPQISFSRQAAPKTTGRRTIAV
jgi:MFS transporter, ceroid-lipofuscinosis neuronal protein 7